MKEKKLKTKIFRFHLTDGRYSDVTMLEEDGGLQVILDKARESKDDWIHFGDHAAIQVSHITSVIQLPIEED